MASNDTLFKVEFTEKCIEEIIEIYEYISKKLKEDVAAKNLIQNILKRILDLRFFPAIYTKIGKVDDLKREYHKMVVKNYIILYTIDFDKRKVFISHVIYQRSNYLEKI